MTEAGIGARVINFLIDTLLIFIISFALSNWYRFYVVYWSFTFYPFYYFFYGTMFVYYTFFELLLSRTPAKFLSLTVVRNVSGGRPAFYQILLRSLLRLTIISPFFIPFLNRPLHDALSNTRVVEK